MWTRLTIQALGLAVAANIVLYTVQVMGSQISGGLSGIGTV